MADQMSLGDRSINFADEMRSSFLDYSMSVIMSRALPDARDGLKPVQRRILYAMLREGLKPEHRFVKCAGVVGEVLKNYHPHGDVAVYETLVRMIQDWVMRYPLAQGQGNFGSIDGDGPAAYRYTETKLSHAGLALMQDLDLGTVDFVDNYNNTLEEPSVLPAALPNLLINGCSGIAVGMATNIPPHNLSEVVEACLLCIDALKDGRTPDMKLIRKVLPGPDFPTGGVILGREGIDDAYEHGRGTLTIRGVMKEETTKSEKTLLVVTEIPYFTTKSRILEKIATLVRDKKLDGISDLRDESDKSGIRIAIELKKGAPKELITEKLFKLALLQQNFSVNMVALDGVQPRLMNVLDLLTHFLSHRKNVVERRLRFQLEKLKNRLHVASGLAKVLDGRDEYLKKILPVALNKSNLKETIEKRFDLDEIQSEAVVILANYRFTKDEYDGILKELAELKAESSKIVNTLRSPEKIWGMIRDELKEAGSKFTDKRRTTIQRKFEEVDTDTLIPDSAMVVALTRDGFVKRYGAESEKVDEGKSRLVLSGEEPVLWQAFGKNHDQWLMVGSLGSIGKIKIHEIPEMRRHGKGEPLANILKLKEKEEMVQHFTAREGKNKLIVCLTESGVVRVVSLDGILQSNRTITAGVRLKAGDRVVGAALGTSKDRFVAISRAGRLCLLDTLPPAEKGEGINLGDDEWIGIYVVPTKRSFILVGNSDGKIMKYAVPVNAAQSPRSLGKDLVGAVVTDESSVFIALGSRGEKYESVVKDIKTSAKATDVVAKVELSGNSKLKHVIAFEVVG